MNPAPRIAAACLAVALAAGLTGCRQRLADQPAPSTPAASQDAPQSGAQPATTAPATTGPAGGAQPPVAAASGKGTVSQQDLDNLQGILTSVNGAVTSARSAIAGDAATPQG